MTNRTNESKMQSLVNSCNTIEGEADEWEEGQERGVSCRTENGRMSLVEKPDGTLDGQLVQRKNEGAPADILVNFNNPDKVGHDRVDKARLEAVNAENVNITLMGNK